MEFNDIEKSARDVIKKIDKGDLVISWSESTPVDFDMDHLKSVENVDRFSMGLRIFEKGRVGNSFINSLDDTGFLIQSAKDSAAFGDEIDIELPGPDHYPDPGFCKPEVLAYSKEEGIALGETIVKTLKSIDSEAKISAGISKSYHKSGLFNTNGFEGTYEETHFSVSANMILVEEGGSLLYVGDSDTVYGLDADLDKLFRNIEWRYRNSKKKCSVKTGYFPVLFSPEAMDLLLEPIEIAANSKTLYKKISVLGDKTGQKVCSEKFTLTDDPLYPGGLGSYPYDDEGVLPKKTDIIQDGVFRNFIYDLTMAKRLGRKSTGHAGRSVSSLPSPSFSNMMIKPGDQNLEEMISSMDYGLVVYEFLGGGMSNVLAGDISVNIELGYLIENGKVKGRVKDAMLSGNSYEMLSKIRSVENTAHKRGSLYTPHILLDSVSISGK